jgi:hypothetical protein
MFITPATLFGSMVLAVEPKMCLFQRPTSRNPLAPTAENTNTTVREIA